MQPNTPEYWKIFYSIQAILLTECSDKYPPQESTYDDSPLNIKAHELALLIYNISMQQYRISMHGTKLLVIEAKSYDAAVKEAVHLYGLEVSVEVI